MGAVAFGAIGTKTAGSGTTVSPPLPSGFLAGDLLIAGRVGWSSGVVADNETGWTAAGDRSGGTGSSNDAHVTRARGDYRIAQAGDGTPSFDMSGTVGGSIGAVAYYRKSSPRSTWDVAATEADDNTHAANRSTSGAGSISWQVGDVCVCIVAVDTDAALTITAQSVAATNVTFGAMTRRTSGSGSTAGQDGNIEIFDATVTGVVGTPTTAPSFSMTTATSQCGPVAFIRIREVNATSTGKNVALVVADKTAPSADDVALQNMLVASGHTVTLRSDEETVLAGQDAHVISESVSPGTLSTTYNAEKVLTFEINSWDDMLMTSAASVQNGSGTAFDLETHDITTGLADPLTVRTASGGLWGQAAAANLASGAVIFARHPTVSTHIMGFTLDDGATRSGGGTNTGRKVALGYIENWGSLLTYDGKELALLALDWTMVATGGSFDETGRQVSIASTVATTDAAHRSETGKAVSVASTVASTSQADWEDPARAVNIAAAVSSADGLGYTEASQVNVTSSVATTDHVDATETTSVTVTATVASTDDFTGTSHYDETNRPVSITAPVAVTDQADWKDALTVSASSTVSTTDEANRSDLARQVNVAATLTVGDQADFKDPRTVTVASTVTSTDETAGSFTELNLPVTIAATVTKTDRADLAEPTRVTATATVASTGRLDAVDARTIVATATATAADLAAYADQVALDILATVSLNDGSGLPDLWPIHLGVYEESTTLGTHRRDRNLGVYEESTHLGTYREIT